MVSCTKTVYLKYKNSFYQIWMNYDLNVIDYKIFVRLVSGTGKGVTVTRVNRGLVRFEIPRLTVKVEFEYLYFLLGLVCNIWGYLSL